jgi:hypothetical protein
MQAALSGANVAMLTSPQPPPGFALYAQISFGRNIMLQISAQQLAELLSGIARAQAAVMNGIDSAMAGIKSQHILPALNNAAHLRDRPDPTLVDLPVRILMSYQSRVGPDIAAIARDLERLCQGSGAASASASPPAAAAPAAGADEALDFSSFASKP